MQTSLMKQPGPKTTFIGKRLFILGLICLFSFMYNPTSAAAPEAIGPEWRKQLTGGPITDSSSPTLADIDNDGFLEIIIGTSDNLNNGISILAVLEHTGDLKWSKTIANNVGSSVTVADISYPPDGVPEIIVPTGADVYEPYGTPGKIVVYSNTGNFLWEFVTSGQSPFPGGDPTPSGNFAAPIVGDVDGDGDMEIVVNSWDRNIYLLDHLGNRLWFYHVADTIWSTPVLVDVDNDGDLEIVTGTDISGGGILPDGTHTEDGGFLLVLDKNGNKVARRHVNETIYSSIAAGDADGDGQIEFFVGTGFAFYMQGNYTQAYVYGFRVDTSSNPWEIVDLPGWPRPVARPGMSSPALADLDGNGDLEVVIGSGYMGLSNPNACSNSSSDPDCFGAIYAWHHNGQAVNGFPVWPREPSGKNGFIRSSPTVADVDNDGQQEIVFSLAWSVLVLSRNGVLEETMDARYSVFGSPAIGDLDNDGRTNVVIGGSEVGNPNFGYVHNFEYGSNSYNGDLMDWPTFHRDERNSGVVPQGAILAVNPESLVVLHDEDHGSTAQSSLTISNVGDGSFSWSYTAANGVTLTPSSGTVSTQQVVTVNINANRPPGWYDLGSITVTASQEGRVMDSSPIQIPLRLFVGQLEFNFLPAILR